MASVCCIVLAAGNSKRMGENKMFLRIGGKYVLERTLEALQKSGCFERIIIACRGGDMQAVETISKRVLTTPFVIAEGGGERQFSVGKALDAAAGFDIAAVHDGARCFVSPDLIRECVKKAVETGAAAAGVRARDTTKTLCNDIITGTVDRENLVNIQTPQVFKYGLLKAAHDKANAEGFVGTDECVLLERMGIPISFVEADRNNIKITTPEDILLGKLIAGENTRTGWGCDSHRFSPNRPLILGGVNIPHTQGLLGHSDADVLIHAVIDALLGAAAAKDIGAHFPCTGKFAGISSLLLLERTRDIIADKGYRIINIDATVIMERPKLSPYVKQMRENIAAALQVDITAVSVKATTTEGMGFEGSEEGASACAIAAVFG